MIVITPHMYKGHTMKLNQETIDLLNEIDTELKSNGGKLSTTFVEDYSNKCTYEYGKVGTSARVCVMTTTNGNKVVGSALVLDPNNDVAEIGNNYARKDCVESLWSFLGGLAKTLS